jgi:hypothetical protein
VRHSDCGGQKRHASSRVFLYSIIFRWATPSMSRASSFFFLYSSHVGLFESLILSDGTQ